MEPNDTDTKVKIIHTNKYVEQMVLVIKKDNTIVWHHEDIHKENVWEDIKTIKDYVLDAEEQLIIFEVINMAREMVAINTTG